MNILDFEGRRYMAVDAPLLGSCGDCAFKCSIGCRLAVATGKALDTCSPVRRNDGRSIFWVPLAQ